MDKEQTAIRLMKALAYVENGGKPKLTALKAGHSGEMKSIFQFTPETWKGYAKEITKQKDLPITPETEAAVVHAKITKWLDEGYNPQQIASMWNAGPGKPNAYLENHKGVNKYGVAYDTPGYVKQVEKYMNQFQKEVPQSTPNQPMNQMVQPTGGQVQAPSNIGQLVQLATANKGSM